MNQHQHKRRGTILIAVLVCLGIATSILLGAVQSSLRHRLQLRQDLQLEQTKWLLDAGVGRAVSQLQTQPGYEGETLSLGPTIGQYLRADIEISAIRNNDSMGRVRMRVVARLGGPHEKSPTLQRSREFFVTVNEVNLVPHP